MIRITALLCAAAFGLAACGGSSYGGGSSSSSTTKTSAGSSKSGGGGAYGSSSKSKNASNASSSSSGSHEVELDDNYFKPTTITGKPGSTVTLELKNEGSAQHTFTIDAQHVDKQLTAGKDATVSVKIPTSGSVQFYCKYHQSLGMKGTLKAS